MVNLVILALCIALTGCSARKVTEIDLEAHRSTEIAKEACYKSRALDLIGIPLEAIGYVVMSKNFSDTLLAISGNDPCSTTNLFDAQIAEVKAKNATVTSSLSSITDLTKWGLGFWASTEWVSSIASAGGIVFSGDGNQINQDSFNTAGNENSITTGDVNLDNSSEDNSDSSSGIDENCTWDVETQEWVCI